MCLIPPTLQQFYYFPNRPQLAVDEEGRPAIRFLIFKENLDEIDDDDESAVGFLIFDTSLAWPQDTLDKVADRIQEDLELENPPRLAPLLYREGTVRLYFLDRVTEVPPAEGEEEENNDVQEEEEKEERWVPFIESSGVPSLYGENRAIFSAMLTKRAASLLYGSFEGFLPCGVVYDLKYVGLQDAFNIVVEADWEQVYHHVAKKFSLDLVFVNINKVDILDELIDNQLITIRASLEGVGEEGMEDEFNAVREELQDFILETFFKPVVNPDQADIPGNANDGLQTASRIRNAIKQWPTLGYSRLELNMSEIRSINIDYSVARAVERRIAPQAHLSLFFEDYNLTKEDVVTVVRGDDDLWKEIPFDLAINADYAEDGIELIKTVVVYGDTEDFKWHFEKTFDETVDRYKRDAWFDPEIGHAMNYQYEVAFKPNFLPGPLGTVKSGWREFTGHNLVISPAELYQKKTVELQLLRNFPFERFPEVHTQVRYEDEELGWVHEDSELLSADKKSMSLTFRARQGVNTDVQYKCTFLGTNGKNIETNWQTWSSDLIPIADPLPAKLNVRILVGGDRSKIENLIVDLKYVDSENNFIQSDSIFMTPDNLRGPHTWTVPLIDTENRRYWYSQTILDTEGNMIQTGWVETDRTTLPVGDVYAKRWEIYPRLVGPPLSDNDLECIKVNLTYKDDIHQLED